MAAAKTRGPTIGGFSLLDLDNSGSGFEIARSLRRMRGIGDVEINYVTDKVYVNYDPSKVTPEQIRDAVVQIANRQNASGSIPENER